MYGDVNNNNDEVLQTGRSTAPGMCNDVLAFTFDKRWERMCCAVEMI